RCRFCGRCVENLSRSLKSPAFFSCWPGSWRNCGGDAMTVAATSPVKVPAGTWIRVFLRLFAVQGSWNYETMIGNGIGFSIEPELRLVPGGRGGARYSAAMGRQARYFNAHPYLAGVAVGALARAELDGVPAPLVARFRTALGGPLGSVGDRLVWASWLPLCSLVALAAFGLGARPLFVIGIFL